MKALGSFFLAAAVSGLAWGAAPAVPGTLNYVEGQVSAGGQALDSKSVRNVQLRAGQSLDTQNGKAEILLTPGVFLRLGGNSSVKMISPSLMNTEVQVLRGRASVEVAELRPQNSLRVDENGASTHVLKEGFYDFDADRN